MNSILLWRELIFVIVAFTTLAALTPTRKFLSWFVSSRSSGNVRTRDREIRQAKRIIWRVRVISLSVAVVYGGFALGAFGQFWLDLASAYLVVTGCQTLLGSIGIRLELFSNNPTEHPH